MPLAVLAPLSRNDFRADRGLLLAHLRGGQWSSGVRRCPGRGGTMSLELKVSGYSSTLIR
jgi:hypothetical protein